MRAYGYFLPKDCELHGDEVFSRVARSLWENLGHSAPGPFDGVSVWDAGDAVIARYTMANLFGRPHPPVAQTLRLEGDQYIAFKCQTQSLLTCLTSGASQLAQVES